MGLRKILTDKDPALHKVCKPVTAFDAKLHKLLDEMGETMQDAHGVGLAAPQVGILRRVVIVDTGEEILELVNPTLVETSGEQEGAEGCLSVPGRRGMLKRPMVVNARFQDRHGEWYEIEIPLTAWTNKGLLWSVPNEPSNVLGVTSGLVAGKHLNLDACFIYKPAK